MLNAECGSKFRIHFSIQHSTFSIAMITIRLPATLRTGPSDTLEVREKVATIAQLIDVLDRRIPGFREQLDDSVFNFAVNDELILHHARDRELNAGDVVEVVPTISGG